MSRLTVEQVLALAPDPGSVAAGHENAAVAKWVSAACNEAAVWGEAKGSGARPYQTSVDLGELAYKCSCPSRKFPCKHALGLLLRYAANAIHEGEPPQWVTDWIDKRSAPKPVRDPAKPRDEASAVKRSDKRWSKVLAGCDECEAFLRDAVSQGLVTMHSARSWDQMAARMVDAQAPGIARRLKKIGACVGVGQDWGMRVSGEMGRITLATEAARNLEKLDAVLQQDVKTAIGIPIREEDLPMDEMLVDVWLVLGEVIEEEDRLTTYRSWMMGLGTGRWAMHLSFAVGGQPPRRRFLAGHSFAAIGRYYPSAWPHRVAFSEVAPCAGGRPKGSLWAEACERLCQALSRNPWIESIPVLLSGARLARDGEHWYALDENGASCPIVDRQNGRWRVLALSGGTPCDLFGEWTGDEFRLLAALGTWGYSAL